MNVEMKEGNGVRPGVVPLLLPEDVLDYLLECGLQIDDGDCQRFWSHLEQVNDEIAVKSRNFRRLLTSQCWPVGLHGDEANMGQTNAPFDKIIGIFLNVTLYRPRSTRISRFLLCSIEQSKVSSLSETSNPVLEEIVKSLNKVTEKGIRGRHFIVTELRGDQAWYRYLLQHQSWWKASNICFRCKANTRMTDCYNYCFYDAWRPTQRSTEDFIVDELPEHPSRSARKKNVLGLSVLFGGGNKHGFRMGRTTLKKKTNVF